MIISSNSELETAEIVDLIDLKSGSIIGLVGFLGAGKTFLTKCIAQKLQVKESVTSPTFTIINEYLSGIKPLFHIDFYRLNSITEALDIGISNYLPNKKGVTVVEWADLFLELLPKGSLIIEIKILDEKKREFKFIKK